MRLLWKFLIFIALCKAVHTASDTMMDIVRVNDSSLCDDGWKRFDKHCFKLNRIAKDWRTAAADCRRTGGHLASIHSKGQNDFLRDLSSETGITYWLIGLHDHAVDGIFVWDDGTDIDYTNWSSGEPDGDYTSGDCVAMSFYGSNFGSWYVRPCNLERAYLCQKKVIFTTEDTNTEVDHRAFIFTTEDTNTEMDHGAFATAVITETDDTTIYAMSSARMEIRTDFITVTNFIITLILVIVHGIGWRNYLL